MRKIISILLSLAAVLGTVCTGVSAGKVQMNISFDSTDELVAEFIYEGFYIEDGLLKADSDADTLQSMHYIDDNGCFTDAGNTWLSFDARMSLRITDDEFSDDGRFISLVYCNDNPVYAGRVADRSYISFIYDVEKGCFFLSEGWDHTDDAENIMDPVYMEIDTDSEDFFDFGISVSKGRIRCFYNDNMIFDFKDTDGKYLIAHDITAPFVFRQGGNCIESENIIISDKGYLYPCADEPSLLDIDGFYLKPVSSESTNDTLVFDLYFNDVNRCGVYSAGLLVDHTDNLTLSSVAKLYEGEGVYTFGDMMDTNPYTISWVGGSASLPEDETALVRFVFDVTGDISSGIRLGLLHDPDNMVKGADGTSFGDNEVPAMGYMLYPEEQIRKIIGGVHKMVHYSSKDVTCEEDGVVIKMCENCYHTVKTVNPAHGHDIYTTSKRATCTKDGWRAERCYYCDMNNRVVVPATGHTNTSYPGKEPTCTESGYAAYDICDKCKHSTYTALPATGHMIETYEAKAPTCTESGYNAYESCKNCGLTTYNEIPAAGHDIVKFSGKNPTCTESGYAAYEACVNCEYTTYREIPVAAHSIVKHDAKIPTCTESGYEAYETCTVCDYTTYSEVAPFGHYELRCAAQKPTCTEDGWDSYVVCTRCDYTTLEIIPATGHSVIEVPAKAPTCIESGHDAYEKCENCGYSTYEKIPETGIHTGDTHCDICGAELAPVPAGIPGDTNGDGIVTLTDASMILRYIAKWDVTMDADAADVNDDGMVTLSDVSRILQYIAKWDVVLK